MKVYSVSCTVSNKTFITWLIPFWYSLVMFMLIIWLIYTWSRWTLQHIQYDVVRSNSHRHDSKQDIRGTVLNIAVNGNKNLTICKLCRANIYVFYFTTNPVRKQWSEESLSFSFMLKTCSVTWLCRMSSIQSHTIENIGYELCARPKM